MKRIRLTSFMRETYRDGEISISTLRRRVNDKQIPGGFRDVDGTYWVDMDRFQRGEKPDLVEVALSECDELTLQALAL